MSEFDVEYDAADIKLNLGLRSDTCLKSATTATQ